MQIVAFRGSRIQSQSVQNKLQSTVCLMSNPFLSLSISSPLASLSSCICLSLFNSLYLSSHPRFLHFCLSFSVSCCLTFSYSQFLSQRLFLYLSRSLFSLHALPPVLPHDTDRLLQFLVSPHHSDRLIEFPVSPHHSDRLLEFPVSPHHSGRLSQFLLDLDKQAVTVSWITS